MNDLFDFAPGDLLLHCDGFQSRFCILKHIFQDNIRALVVFEVLPFPEKYAERNTEIVSIEDLDLVKRNFAND